MKSPLVSLSENKVGQIDLFKAERTKNGCIPSDKISVATWQRSRAASLWRPFGPYIQLLRHHIPIILFPSYSLGSTKKIPMNHPHEIPWLPHMFTGPVLLVTSTVYPAYVDKCTLITWILPQRWPISFYIPIDIVIFLAFSNVPSISPAPPNPKRRPVACVYSRTEEMVSSGMDSSSIRFSQKFEHPKSSPYDFSYFSLPPILSVAHMFSDNSWELIQCHRLLALTHENPPFDWLYTLRHETYERSIQMLRSQEVRTQSSVVVNLSAEIHWVRWIYSLDHCSTDQRGAARYKLVYTIPSI